MTTDHSDGEVVVDDVVRDVLHDLVDRFRFVSLLVVNTDPPPVQLGCPRLGYSLEQKIAGSDLVVCIIIEVSH